MVLFMDRVKEVKDYFAAKAKFYDDVDEQSYWVFSDTLLWNLLKKLIIPLIKPSMKLLDAGGGTARWSVKIVKETGCSSTVYDLSSEMLGVAIEKIKKLNLSDKMNVMEGNIEEMINISDNSYDITICFHNVLSFVKSPMNALKELVRVTKKRGYILIIVPNKYHSLYFNIYRGAFEQLDMNLKENKVKFNDAVPEMHTFTPDSIRAIFKECQITPVKVIGFPITIYPGVEETKIHGQTEKLKNIFANEKIFNKLLKMEEEVCVNEDAAGRGNILLGIGKKA
jgi:ubiquinone/menaquinone biosynthesis C-methylase UbiE